MKVLLIFPPQWTPFRPYLSLPSLSAYLITKGIDVVQKDFNLESYNIILSERYLKRISERLNIQFAAMDMKESLSPGTEQKYYHDLFMAKSIVQQVACKVEDAKEVYRDPLQFYNPDYLANATHVIRQALNAVSLAYFPTQLNLSSFNTPSFKGSFEDLKRATFNKIENPYIELFEEFLLPSIHGEKADVIGITVSGESQLIPALTLSRMIKASGTKAHLVVGGYVISMLADILIKYPELYDLFFDSAILNDGEKPLADLVEHLAQGKSLGSVPNLIYRDGNQIRVSKKEPPENINFLPTPTFDGLPLNQYFSPEPVLPLLASRGCYWSKCSFCTHSLAYGLTYQVRDTQKIIDDVTELSQKYGTTHIAFSDEGTSPSLINKLSDEIGKRGQKIRFSTSIRPEKQFTPELCRKMAAAGFREVYIGLESSCDRILNRIEKGITATDAVRIIRNIYEAGIWDHVYVMFGFPDETMEEAHQTFDFICTHKDIIRSLGISNFSVGRNSKVMCHPEKYGVNLITSGDDVDFKLYFDYTVNDGLTQLEAWDLTKECFEKIASKLEGDRLLNKLGHNYDKGCILPLYLSHFEDTDPFLKNVIKIKKPIPRSSRVISLKTRPRLKSGVTLNCLRFNIGTIRQNITDNLQEIAYSKESYTLFDSDECNFKIISNQSTEILALCDGNKRISTVVQQLSEKYETPASIIRKDCLVFFQLLLNEGYLTHK